mmetsp:Transcript_7884/g.15031  ORF Transcript_7884/g.15031 Transcript_7884/m.15031 type:complete len:154 (-) Transcript_7884:242-703(-)
MTSFGGVSPCQNGSRNWPNTVFLASTTVVVEKGIMGPRKRNSILFFLSVYHSSSPKTVLLNRTRLYQAVPPYSRFLPHGLFDVAQLGDNRRKEKPCVLRAKNGKEEVLETGLDPVHFICLTYLVPPFVLYCSNIPYPMVKGVDRASARPPTKG